MVIGNLFELEFNILEIAVLGASLLKLCKGCKYDKVKREKPMEPLILVIVFAVVISIIVSFVDLSISKAAFEVYDPFFEGVSQAIHTITS